MLLQCCNSFWWHHGGIRHCRHCVWVWAIQTLQSIHSQSWSLCLQHLLAGFYPVPLSQSHSGAVQSYLCVLGHCFHGYLLCLSQLDSCCCHVAGELLDACHVAGMCVTLLPPPQYTVVPARRATASSIQILFSHLFGDAISPTVVGAVRGANRNYWIVLTS